MPSSITRRQQIVSIGDAELTSFVSSKRPNESTTLPYRIMVPSGVTVTATPATSGTNVTVSNAAPFASRIGSDIQFTNIVGGNVNTSDLYTVNAVDTTTNILTVTDKFTTSTTKDTIVAGSSVNWPANSASFTYSANIVPCMALFDNDGSIANVTMVDTANTVNAYQYLSVTSSGSANGYYTFSSPGSVMNNRPSPTVQDSDPQPVYWLTIQLQGPPTVVADLLSGGAKTVYGTPITNYEFVRVNP